MLLYSDIGACYPSLIYFHIIIISINFTKDA